jgi:hypothetical protein
MANNNFQTTNLLVYRCALKSLPTFDLLFGIIIGPVF